MPDSFTLMLLCSCQNNLYTDTLTEDSRKLPHPHFTQSPLISLEVVQATLSESKYQIQNTYIAFGFIASRILNLLCAF